MSVFESKVNRIRTTNSWHFLGLDSVYNGNYLPVDSTSNVIVGVIDSGNYFYLMKISYADLVCNALVKQVNHKMTWKHVRLLFCGAHL